MSAVLPAESFLEGMVLAAVVRDDRAGEALEGAHPALARAVRERLEVLTRLSREARHRSVRACIRRLAAVEGQPSPPPSRRAGAILAPDAPPDVGRRWGAQAPPVRRGFEVSRSLRLTLRRLAAPGAQTRNDDREAARALEELPPQRAALLRRLASMLDPTDAEGATGELLRGLRGGDGSSSRASAIGAELAFAWTLQDGMEPCHE